MVGVVRGEFSLSVGFTICVRPLFRWWSLSSRLLSVYYALAFYPRDGDWRLAEFFFLFLLPLGGWFGPLSV